MKSISTENAPKAIGPYSQGIKAGHFLFLSGQLGLDPKTMEFPGNDIKSQTEQSFKNILAILESEKLSMDNVCKVVVYLADIKDFGAMNEIYGKYFTKNLPARSAFQVAELPKKAVVEIEVIACYE